MYGRTVDIEKLFKKFCHVKKDFENNLLKGEDDTYFLNILKYGICIRGISIISNMLGDNFDSVSVDIDARVIIENCAIITALNKKIITFKQYLIAAISSLYTSDKRFLILYGSYLTKEQKGWFEKYISDDLERLQVITNESKEELLKDISTPFSFLKYEESTKDLKVSNFITESIGEFHEKMRKFFSFNIHPSYYSKENFEKVSNIRKGYVGYLLEELDESFEKYDFDLSKIQSYSEYANELLNDEDFHDLEVLSNIFDDTFKESDGMTIYVFKKIKCLLIDIFITGNLISWSYASGRIKILYEYCSMLFHVKKTETEKLWQILSDFNSYFVLNKGGSFDFKMRQLMHEIVNESKNRHNHLKQCEDNYIEKMNKTSLLFFVYGERLSFSKMVRDCAYSISLNEEIAPIYCNFYEKSLNENHASFNHLTAKGATNFKKLGKLVKTYTLGFVYDLYYTLIGKPGSVIDRDFIFLFTLKFLMDKSLIFDMVEFYLGKKRN